MLNARSVSDYLCPSSRNDAAVVGAVSRDAMPSDWLHSGRNGGGVRARFEAQLSAAKLSIVGVVLPLAHSVFVQSVVIRLMHFNALKKKHRHRKNAIRDRSRVRRHMFGRASEAPQEKNYRRLKSSLMNDSGGVRPARSHRPGTTRSGKLD